MRNVLNKLKIPVAGLLLAVGVLVSVNGLVNQAGARDCTPNAVIRCGVTSISDLRDKYAKDYTKGTRNIFSHFGLNSNVINNYNYQRGVAYNNGDVYVGSKKVATGAHSAGRQYQPGSTKHTVNGTTFYKRPLHVWNQKTWDVFVFTDKNGRFLAAVMLICGNPVSAKPVEPPKPPKPQPVYACVSVSRIKQSDPNKYVFRAKSSVANGAKATGFTVEFGDGKSQRVNVQRTEGKYAYADVPYTYQNAGTYNVKLTAHFTANGKVVSHTSTNCQKPVTIPKKPTPPPAPTPKKPGVSIDKQVSAEKKDSGMTKEEALEQARNFKPKGHCTTVMTPAVHLETGARYTFTSGCIPAGWVAERHYDGRQPVESGQATTWVEHTVVAPNQPFAYRLVVKNTGEMTLKNVVVTDPAPSGVTFKTTDKGTIENNSLRYTIPELKVGASTTIIITAVVTEYVEGRIENTACVDAPEVPGTKDDCDDASVEVKKPETPPVVVKYIEVCRLEDKVYPVTINEDDFDAELHSKDPNDCKEAPAPVAPEEPKVPKELPQTGLSTALNGVLGVGSLTAASYYYLVSRRNS